MFNTASFRRIELLFCRKGNSCNEMGKKRLISKQIEFFYTRASEETRLDKGMGVFEFARIKTLIEKYLTPSSAKIVDVGGGPGKYSEWLARKGHSVSLVDPVPKHIELAKRRAGALKNKFHARLGEARNLDYPDNLADLVILHGPLYHLQNKEDREKAIAEAKRVIRPGGIVLGFSINYTASTLVGLLQGLIHREAFFKMCTEELTTGFHNPPDDFPWLLVEAYYHRPEELKEEFEGQGLKCLNIHAVEGMAWLDKDYFSNMSGEKSKRTLLELIEITENDMNLLSFSPHMMIASRKDG
ncbi:class I SAM-dependent methyltransferase [Pareuzebyella sediminis]|uniref:class I SAM-dependent methyltransferase n=1 Tax=Pareuzebyella sediminis TaxID=2607998 RepID=UPI001E42D62C|nr:class I SAM-dependent methyltransferase [Pareuzebyella sediminis]